MLLSPRNSTWYCAVGQASKLDKDAFDSGHTTTEQRHWAERGEARTSCNPAVYILEHHLSQQAEPSPS